MTGTEKVPAQGQAFDVDAAARASLLRLTPRRWRLIRLFELLLRPVVALANAARGKRPSVHDSPATILVIEYWNMGDIVNLLPFLAALRTGFPAAKISLLANPAMRDLLAPQNLVDEVLPFRTPWSAHFSRWRKYNPFSPRWLQLARDLRSLRRRHFDMMLTGRMDVRDNFLAWMIGAPRRVGYGFAGGAFLLTDVVPPNLARPHRSEVWLELLRYLGKPVLTESARLRLSEAEERFASSFLREHGIEDADCLVGIHAGARIATRRWGAENFAAVAKRVESELGAKIVWFVDPKQQEEEQRHESNWVRASLPFREFLAVLSRCQLLLCNDSGPMHLATALGVPVVAVFGPTEPAWFGPRGKSNRVVIRPGFWCRPCFDYCIFKEPYCIRAVSREEVYSAASESFARRNTGRSQPSAALPDVLGDTRRPDVVAARAEFRSSAAIPVELSAEPESPSPRIRKVLVVHNFYQQSGGEDVVFAAEKALLRAHGHEVVEYCEDNHRIDGMNRLALAATTIWSRKARRGLESILQEEKPDIAHFHNTFPLISPAAYYACREAGVPVVQTLHNYRLLCAGGNLSRDSRVCEDCLGRSFGWPGIVHGCYRGSRLESAGAATMVAMHRAMGTWTELVDVYIALTEFSRQKFIAGGLPAEKIVVKPNFVDIDPGPRPGPGDYALYLGRLSPEKGASHLVRAWSQLKQEIPLFVVGDGPLRAQMEKEIGDRGLRGVKLLGRVDRGVALDWLKGARFLVAPSECFEAFPLAVVEAFACGTPVIAARLGALEELVTDGKTGFHFAPGDVQDLARKVEWAWSHPRELETMGRAVRSEYETRYAAERNYALLTRAYAIGLAKLTPARGPSRAKPRPGEGIPRAPGVTRG